MFLFFSNLTDRLTVTLFKDVSDASRPDAKPKTSFQLEGYLGLDTGFSYDKEDNVMAIVCLKVVYLLSFELREEMIHFEIKIRQSLGEGKTIDLLLKSVYVKPNSLYFHTLAVSMK